jgi:hypothetical protein
MVGWDGDISSRPDFSVFKQDQRDAALIVHLGDDEGSGLVELVFELGASAIWFAGDVGSVDVFEHDTFFALAFELGKPATFFRCGEVSTILMWGW